MNRITSSVLYSLTGAAMLSSLPSCKVKKESDGNEKKSMNIVYIMCDDHSFQTISAYDQRYMQTPNIDRIANEGVRFTNSFVANSLSGPSRACMLTVNIVMPMDLRIIPPHLTVTSRLSRNCFRLMAIRLL